MHLKQNNFDALKSATDFLIDHQVANKEWSIKSGKGKYDSMVEEVCRSFAEFAAILDREYIFAWIDWDGDNILANAGIIGGPHHVGFDVNEAGFPKHSRIVQWATVEENAEQIAAFLDLDMETATSLAQTDNLFSD